MSGLYLNRGKGLQNNAGLTANSNPEEAQRNKVFSQHQREREVRKGRERRKEEGGRREEARGLCQYQVSSSIDFYHIIF